MFDYLILTTRGLLLAATVCGVIAGYVKGVYEKKERRLVWIFGALGLLFSVAVAVLRNTTSKVDSAILNGIIYGITLVVFLILPVFLRKPSQQDTKGKKVLSVIGRVLLGISMICVLVCTAPDVLAYPYRIYLAEHTLLSTDFLLGVIGVLLGFVLVAVLYITVTKSVSRLEYGPAFLVLWLALLINAAVRLSGLYAVLTQKRLITSIHALFEYTVFVKNHSDFFAYAALLLVLVVSISLWIASFRQKEPYHNPAEHRKIRAKWRGIRMASMAAVVAGIISILNMTVVEAMNQEDTTLSPIEPYSSIDDENIYVSFDLVSDGHLHRFAYKSPSDIEIRFIIIKKPNSSSYGVGLDACDVCGQTGYYERDDKVVCNLCDVVMNISTIGFKGGCNPIVIPYEVKDGQIILPISGLMEYEKEFR